MSTCIPCQELLTAETEVQPHPQLMELKTIKIGDPVRPERDLEALHVQAVQLDPEVAARRRRGAALWLDIDQQLRWRSIGE